MRAQAGDLGLEGRLQFLGFVGDMTALYPALDLLLMTSRYEGLPLTIYEALAARTPIIASDHPMFRGALVHQENALVYPAGDAQAQKAPPELRTAALASVA